MVNVSNLTHCGPTVRTSDGVSGVDPAKSRVGRVGEHIHGVYVWRRSGAGWSRSNCLCDPTHGTMIVQGESCECGLEDYTKVRQ